MKKIKYNYYYCGEIISEENFKSDVSKNCKNWKTKCVRNPDGSWSYGYYTANPRD